jgi:hypothetical protein
MPPERKGRLMEFFEWFGDHLPPPRASVLPPAPAAPTAIPAISHQTLPTLTDEEASAIVSDPGTPAMIATGTPRSEGTPMQATVASVPPPTGTDDVE